MTSNSDGVYPMGATLHLCCTGPDCFHEDPHYHQHWIISPTNWPASAQ